MNKATKDEYEIQHYGFCVDDLMRSFFTMVLDSMSSVIDDLVEQTTKMQKTSIASNLSQIHAAWLQQVTPIFESLTSEVQQIFEIPENVALPEDLVYSENTHEDIPQLKCEIKELTEEHIRLQAYREMLKKELEILEGIEPVLEKTKQFVKECDDASKECKNVMGELEQQINDCKISEEEQIMCTLKEFEK